MQAFLATFHGIWSLVILGLFLGIIAWVFSAKRKKSFDEAGRIPLDDDD
jgi:cytochrome c oxidase cbb3-type subunit IV